MPRRNELGQPIGDPLPENWVPPARPKRQAIDGRRARIEPLIPETHGADLWESNNLDRNGEGWTYMGYGPFHSFQEFQIWLEEVSTRDDPLYFAFKDKSTGKAAGWGAYLRINVRDGCIEVGSIRLSPLMQRTAMATEVMHLMMKNVFDLGYRRYEWKCDALNAPSCRAAERLGFRFEGVFRQATHYKGRNRDTAWYSIIDTEWPAICAAQSAWLDPSNFDDDGRQVLALSSLLEQT